MYFQKLKFSRFLKIMPFYSWHLQIPQLPKRVFELPQHKHVMWCFSLVFSMPVCAQHPRRSQSQRETNSLNTGELEPKSFEAGSAQPAALFSSVSSRQSGVSSAKTETAPQSETDAGNSICGSRAVRRLNSRLFPRKHFANSTNSAETAAPVCQCKLYGRRCEVHLKDSIEKNDAPLMLARAFMSRRSHAGFMHTCNPRPRTKDKLSLGKKQSSVWLLLAARSSDHAHHLHPPPIKVTSNLFAWQTRRGSLAVFQRDLIKHTAGLSGAERAHFWRRWIGILFRWDWIWHTAVGEINYWHVGGK
jgi:hypothetical protein